MSWLSKLLGNDARKRKQQLAAWQGAGSGRRLETGAIDEGNRAQRREGDYQQSRNQYLDLLNNGQQAFNESARAAVEAAMPSFNSQLNGIRESAIRRGVQNGELGTSYEGDLASAFDKNLTNAISGQALNLYGTRLSGYGGLMRQDYGAEEDSTNRYLDLLVGDQDRKELQRQRKLREQQGWAGLGVDLLGRALPWNRGGGSGGTG